MEEIVYTILYRKQILLDEQGIYQFVPCYVIKGLYDEENHIFLDEMNKIRYLLDNKNIIEEHCDYCVGEIYQETDLHQLYPESSNIEEMEIKLLEEEKKSLTIGVYKKQYDKIDILKYDDNYLQNHSIEDVITSNLDNKSSDTFDLLINDIIILPHHIEEMMKIDDTSKMYQFFCDRIKSNLQNIYDYTKSILEQSSNDCIRDIEESDLTMFDDLKPIESDDEIDELEDINIFDVNSVIEILEETKDNISQASTLNQVQKTLNQILKFYQTSMSVIEMLREQNYHFFKTYHHFYIQTQYINKLLKLNDIEMIKRKYLFLYYKSKCNMIPKIKHELEYDIENVEKENAFCETSKQLNQLVGLENVKETFEGIFSLMMFKNKTSQNLLFEQENKHMVFIGNPGTGKTTVAGIIAPLFHKLGYNRTDKVAYVAAEDLVAEYVGQTAIKTKKLIQKNKGGIIVVDEAYILSSDAQRFGNEAITVILKEMEKNETMFIFAGYQKEMEDFIKMNSGLKSRISSYIYFDDYNEKELLTMFMNRVKNCTKDKNNKSKLTVSVTAMKKVKDIIIEGMQQEDFGNGRFIKNLFDHIITEHAKNVRDNLELNRVYKITDKDIPDDVLDKILFAENHQDSYRSTNMGFNAKIKSKSNDRRLNCSVQVNEKRS